MYTLSGKHVTLDDGVPTLNDIAQGLAWTPRFQGQMRRFCPLLVHAHVVADLGEPEFELFALLADAEKACLGDWCESFQLEEVRMIREHLRQRIFWERFGIERWPAGAVEAVKEADRRATTAEVRLLAHPRVVSWSKVFDPAPEDTRAGERLNFHLDRYPAVHFLLRLVGPIRDFEVRVEHAWQHWKVRQVG